MRTAELAAFLESLLPLIESIVTEVARRQRVRGDELDEFRSLAFLKLVERDYAVLRRFQGNSRLRTYLTVVLQRVLLDHRNKQWGRWRPSAAAHRGGPIAVRLEKLVVRDGLAPNEALAALAGDADVSTYAAFVAALRARGPVRGSRHTLGEDAIPECFDPAPGPDARAEAGEQASRAARLGRVMQRALRTLDSEDHLVLTLRFRDGLSVADTARVLGLEMKPLYRRIDRILARVLAILSADPANKELAVSFAQHLWSDGAPAGESGWWRPSNGINGLAVTSSHDVAGRNVSRRRAAGRVYRGAGRDAMRGGDAPSV